MSNTGEVWQDDGDGRAQPPRRKTSNLRVILIILSACGLCCVLFCGAMGLFFWSLLPDMSPAGVQQKTQQIVAIEIPERFKPVLAWNFLGQLRFVIYQTGDRPQPELIIVSYSKQMQGNGQNPKEQMKNAMRQQGKEQVELDIEKSTTREFTIRGKKCKFQFADAKDPDTDEEFRQVTGSFPANTGEGLLILQLPAEDYDEAEVVEMIESIH